MYPHTLVPIWKIGNLDTDRTHLFDNSYKMKNEKVVIVATTSWSIRGRWGGGGGWMGGSRLPG